MTTYVGLDLGKFKAHASVQNEKGEEIAAYEDVVVSRESLQALACRLPAGSRVALETSTNAYPVYQILQAAGHEVVISNPLLTKAIASAKVKTDKVDASVLAHMLRLEYLPTVWAPDEATYELRTLCAHRASLLKTSTRYKNKVHSILARNLVTLPLDAHSPSEAAPRPMFSDLFGGQGRQWLQQEALPKRLPAHEQLQMRTSLAMLDAAREQLQEVEKELYRRAADRTGPWHANVQRLVTIPGVDVLSALSILAAIGDVSRFNSAKKLASYFGVTPRVYQSGHTEYHGRICKAGTPLGRWALIQCARAQARADGAAMPFHRRVKSKKGPNIAAVALARKLAVLIWHMLTKQTDYWYERELLTRNKRAKLRLRGEGRRLKPGPRAQGEAAREPAATGGTNYRQAKAQAQARPGPGKALLGPPARPSRQGRSHSRSTVFARGDSKT